MTGILVRTPSLPRQVLSRCLRPAGVRVESLTGDTPSVGSVPPLSFVMRSVLVASVAYELPKPKSVLKGAFQSLKRAVWREKSKRLARLLPRGPSPDRDTSVCARSSGGADSPIVVSSSRPPRFS